MNQSTRDESITARSVFEQPEALGAAYRAALPAEALSRPRLALVGTGSSLHACRIAASWLTHWSAGQDVPVVLEAHSACAVDWFGPDWSVVIVSHRGTKRYARMLLETLPATGAEIGTVTGVGGGADEAAWGVETVAQEESSTHTISYTTALMALARLLCRRLDSDRSERIEAGLAAALREVDAVLQQPLAPAAVERIAGCDRGIVAGEGIDAVTAAEGALKFNEGTYCLYAGLTLEGAVHGPLAAQGPHTGAVLLRAGQADRGRTDEVAGSLARLGARTLVIGDAPDDELRIPRPEWLTRPFVLVAALQRLVLAVAAARGTNPDTIRSDEEPWGEAMRSCPL